MAHDKRLAVGLVLLMLASYLAAVAQPYEALEQDTPQRFTGTHEDQAFTDGSTVLTGAVGSPINPSVPVAYGYSMTSGTVQLSLAGSQVTHTDTYSVASGLLNGTLNDTVNDGSSIQLMSSMAGPPQAGTNSSTILSTTNLAGTHSYDTLELLCGIASCGRIVATGDLTLYVNTLRVEQGTSIQANDLATGGLGAGGSTTTSTNGRNDGGGGAGHGGSGGAGGGTNGGSAGSTYGNGTERGSQGGTVSSSYHSTANGGKGGGYIRIFANHVFVNGSIHANGGNGDAGSQASSGTGAGGSGGGGGSGGSISIQANAVSVGNGGQIKADGGDGGDGANGAQNGPGFGMYDGGDGGGGGGGGRIVINTQANGYSNAGTVNAIGGSGGSKGLKYGTGVDGIDGSGGSNGVVTTGTWNGYVASGNTTSNNGTFTSTMLQTQSSQPSPAYITHNAAVPADASLTVAYRYTLNGTAATEDEWSGWQPLSLSGEWVPRHQWLQLEYTFSRTGSNSPELSDFTIQHTSWTTLHGTDVRYDGQHLGPTLSNTAVGLTSTFNDTSTAQQPQVTLQVPVDATFDDDLHLWMQWEDSGTATPITFQEASIGAVVVNSTAQNHSVAGIDLTIPKADLNNVQASSTWTDGNGIEWHAITVDFTLSDSTNVWFGHLQVPWSYSTTLEVKDTINDLILAECTSFYTFTAATCFGPATSHRFSTAGTTQPTGAPGFTFTLDEPSFAWEDAYAPQLASLEHRQGLEQYPDLRVNETFSMILFDLVGEDDLVVEYLGLNWEEAQGFGSATSMTYHNALQGYYLYLNTDGLEADLQHEYNMTFRVLDANGNELLPRPTYNLTVYPVAPEVASVSVTGPTLLDPGMPGEPSIWGVSGAMMTFRVEDAHHRETLSVTAELTKDGATQPSLLPLVWNPEERAYMMDWLPMRSDLGDWEVEISMAELGYPSASDDDGWREGVDLHLRLVDGQGPFVENVSFPSTIEQGDAFSVNIDWIGDEAESYRGSIAVRQEGSEIANMTIMETTQRNAALLFDSSAWTPGSYEVAVHLQDDAGNPAFVNPEASSGFEVLKPWIDWNLSLTVENINDLRLVGTVESRSGTAVLSIAQQGGTWNITERLVDGQVDLTLEMNELLTPSSNFSVQLCDENDNDNCASWVETLSFDEAFAIDLGAVCTLSQINETSLESQPLLSCTLANRGHTPLNARLVVDDSQNLVTEAITVGPGEQGAVVLTMVAGEDAVNETVAWTLFVTNNGGAQKVVEMGQVQAVRTVQESTNTQGEETVASEEGNGPMVGLLLLVMVGLALAGLFIYRKNTSSEIDIKEASADVEEQLAQSADWNMVEENEPFSDASSAVVGPEPHTPPTSVDDNGYEWYSTAEGHWYRTAGSQSEWIPYQ